MICACPNCGEEGNLRKGGIMNVYLVLTEWDYDPTEIWGVFTSLESAEAFIDTLYDVEPLAEDEYDECDPESQVRAYWVHGKLVRILKEKLRD